MSNEGVLIITEGDGQRIVTDAAEIAEFFQQADNPGYVPSAEQEALWKSYQYKPMRQFYQFDGWAGDNVRGDDVIDPEGEGWGVMSGVVDELRTSDNAVRVQINQNANRESVLFLLRKITEYVERDWNEVVNPPVLADYMDDDDIKPDYLTTDIDTIQDFDRERLGD